MPLNPGRIQIERVPEDPCIRFQLWYGGNKARRHTTETRARAVIKSIPAKLGGLKALEVGSAWGYLSFLMGSYGATVTASDILVEDLLFGAKVREMNSGNGAVDFCAADALTLPFPDASFDATISMEMIEHIEGGPEKVCVEFARVTKAGGFVIISTPNPYGVAQMVKNRLKQIPALRRRYSFLDYDEWFLSPAEVLSAADNARLRLLSLRRTGLTVPFVPDWLFPLNLVLEKAFKAVPILLTTNIFIFQKY
jgi:2-polyprenyl-3-methyl-5-hydroxy-6-metoxy-1,4-benzoquinol methylase